MLKSYWFASRSLQNMQHQEVIYLSNSFSQVDSGYIQIEYTQL